MAATRGTRKRSTAKRKSAAKKTGPAGLTAAKRKKLLDTIRLGVNKDDAARLVGIGRSTFFEWLEKGKHPDAEPAYAKFADDVEVALLEFESKRLGVIDAASGEEWQAAAWLLERKFPDRYGRRTRVDSNVTVTAKPMLDASKLTPDELETLIGLLRKASPVQEELEQDQRPALALLPGVGDDAA